MFAKKLKEVLLYSNLLIGILLGLLSLPAYAVGQSPAHLHAHQSIYGSVWECDRGFRQEAGGCTRVRRPETRVSR
jgi:hypothetical protein